MINFKDRISNFRPLRAVAVAGLSEVVGESSTRDRVKHA